MFSAIPNVAILQNGGAAAPQSRTLDFSDPPLRPCRATRTVGWTGRNPFRTIQVCPKDRLTFPPAGSRCGKPPAPSVPSW